MKIRLLIILVLLVNTKVLSQDIEKYTLDYCIKRALENNQEIKSTEFDVISAQSKISSAETERLPTVDFFGNYSRLSIIDPFSITMPTGKAIDIFPVILNNYGLNLTLKQPVFTGSRIKSNYEIAKNTFLAKENNLEEVKNSIKYMVEDYFWRLVYAIESKRVVDESIELTKIHLQDVKNLKENGMASENDVKKVEVQLSNMELMKTTIEKNIELSRAVLCKTMNAPIETSFEPDYDLPSPEFNYNFKEITSKAIEKRPLLKSMEFYLQSAEEAKEVVKSSFYPSVYLVGNYNYARPNRRILPMKDKWADTWDAGVVVQFTIWNWGKKRMDYESAQNDFLKVKTDYENLKSQIELDIKRIFLDINESLKRYQLSNKMVDQAEENYRISRDKYKNGMLLNSEFLDAEVDLLKSKLEVTRSIMDFNIKMAELKKAAGIYE